jgi:uncharacterized protein
MTRAGYRIRPGHALGLSLASSDYPTFLPYPGTTENAWLATCGQPSTRNLTTSGSPGSDLTLTVLP